MEKTMKRPCEGPCVLTDSKIVLVRNRGEHFKAVAEITLNDSFVVRGLRIMSGTEGLFVSYPAEARDSQYRTIAGPTSPRLRAEISESLLSDYRLMTQG